MKKISILAVLTILTATLFSTSSLAQTPIGKSNLWNGSQTSTITDGNVLIRDNTSQGFGGKVTIQNNNNVIGLVLKNSISTLTSRTLIGADFSTEETYGASLYGIKNNVLGTSDVYGYHSAIHSTSPYSTAYGIYVNVTGEKETYMYGIYSSISGPGYAGYFEGPGYFSGSLQLNNSLIFKNSTSSLNLSYSSSSLSFDSWFKMLSSGAFEFGSSFNKFTMGTALENNLKTLTITPGNQKFYSNGSAFIPGGIKFAATSGMLIKQTTTSSGKQAVTIAPGGFMFRNDGNMEVHGTIYAKEVLVSMPPFPDYVFEKDYSMMSLDQLEKYIASNGHLPNIPSATEIEENGIGLGELSVIQMEKIEEISLYLIELNNKIKALELENQELKAALKKAE